MREGLRRGLGAGVAGAGFSWRRPRALDGVSCSSSSDVGRERGFRDFSDLGVGAGASRGGVALRWRGDWRWGVMGLDSVMMPGVRLGGAVMDAGGGAEWRFWRKGVWRPKGADWTATADMIQDGPLGLA